ncbi:MAG: 3-deoxy-7-phosphoheptulonate synthase, partial [Lachnospiraceae bacterium]
SVAEAENALAKAKVSNKIMIDTSHANSNKDPYLQPLVLKNITEQILDGNKSIVGLMVESHLKGGRQDIPENLDDLEYGQSVTDGCIDWETTEKALLDMHEALKDVLPNR